MVPDALHVVRCAWQPYRNIQHPLPIMIRTPTWIRRFGIAVLAAAAAASAHAISVDLYVDAAPNVYGSPDYPAWWANAQTSAVDGTFVNMANSTNPANAGTNFYQIEDATVYSFGDLGKRLHFVYWVPGETINSLTAMNFQLSLDYDWDGVNYSGFAPYTPTSWLEYSGGVIGTAGWAWWGAYGVNTQAALDADLASWRPYYGDINLNVHVGGQEIASITVTPRVPEAGWTAGLIGVALVGFAGFRRRMSRRLSA